MTNHDGVYLTRRNVAERLGVSVRTVSSWIAAGRLRAIRLSARCVRVEAAELDRFVEASKK